MGGGTESGRTPKKQIDAEAETCFLQALRAGETREAAALAAGFTVNAFYYVRKRDPVFALAYDYAMGLSAAEARAVRGPRADRGEAVIAPNRNRLLQKRHVRRPRFDDRRKRVFLDHYAATANAEASCAAAGIACSTYTQHRRKDPEFDAACDEALLIACKAMEADVVRDRLEMQRNLREGIVPVEARPAEFERTMRVLARFQRPGGGIGLRTVAHGAQKRGTFMEGIAWLDRALRGLGIRWDIAAAPIELPGSAAPGDPPAGEAGG